MTPEQRQHSRKYFALGAFKLDTSLELCLFLAYYVLAFLCLTVSAGLLTVAPWVRILVVISVAYLLRGDGLNDLGRAFNVALLRSSLTQEDGRS